MNCDNLKKCYFYWGGDKLPLFNALSLVSFKKYHPEYKIYLYRPIVNHNTPTWGTPEQKIPYIGDDFSYIIPKIVDDIFDIDLTVLGFSNEIHHSQKADIIRQWLLLNEGGWWSDMDVLWIKNIEEMNIEESVDLGVCFQNGHHSSGIMFSRPKTQFYTRIWEQISGRFNTNDYQSGGPNLLNNLFPNFQSVVESDTGINVVNFKLENFYPIYYTELSTFYNGVYVDNILTEDTYAIHWYNGNNMSGDFVNAFNMDSLETSDLFVYKIIRDKIGIDTITNYI